MLSSFIFFLIFFCMTSLSFLARTVVVPFIRSEFQASYSPQFALRLPKCTLWSVFGFTQPEGVAVELKLSCAVSNSKK